MRWMLFRLRSLFRRSHCEDDLAEELRFHLEEEAEAQIENGLTSEEARNAARRSLGNLTLTQEHTREVWLLGWLEQTASDLRFGLRQMLKSKVVSAAAILSLALAIGNCAAAFRLLDALFLRPLPVSHPEELHVVRRQSVGPEGNVRTAESTSYPLFRMMREAAGEKAELLAISMASRIDITYGSNQESEKAYRQFVSGTMFRSFALLPEIGRLLTEDDDRTPGAHPYAVISHDYWTRRFGQDRKVIGKTFRMDKNLYEIVGVMQEGFTGTEPGTAVDLYVPTMMNAASIDRPYNWWFRTYLRIPKGIEPSEVRDRLQAALRSFLDERAKTLTGLPEALRRQVLSEEIVVEPASSGASGMQRVYRLGLIVLGVLVALVLLIACANIANLMTARAMARERELALRVSIGAGRWRLIRLVAMECVWIATFATLLGTAFAAWAANFVVTRINPPDNPARLNLGADWRLVAFTLCLALIVTLLFGLLPALRASATRPASSLKGGEDPQSKRRIMQSLVAVQVAFCLLVLFISGLFVATYDRLTKEPIGFNADSLLVVEALADERQPYTAWKQLADRVAALPGVESATLSGWPLLSNQGWNAFVSTNTTNPEMARCDFLRIAPGWLQTMGIPLYRGRDFVEEEKLPDVAIVNQALVDALFPNQDPIGRTLHSGVTNPVTIVGVMGNTRYWDLRAPITAAAYFPLRTVGEDGAPSPLGNATLMVRTSLPNPAELANSIRREVPVARPEFWVSNIDTQVELIERNTIRERLIALLAVFFSFVSLVLSVVGLFGVLDYSVLQRRREIGIRVALGSPAGNIVLDVTKASLTMVLVGTTAGLGIGVASARYLESLLYGVTSSEPAVLVVPTVALIVAAALAAIPPVLRALRLNPVEVLRGD